LLGLVHLANLAKLFLLVDYFSTLIGLYYIIISVDGNISEKEVVLGKKMTKAEGFEENRFESTILLYQTLDFAKLYKDMLVGLRKLQTEKQIRCISWMCVIANSDGFMDKRKWELIYKIYHTELALSLDEIMKTQGELNKILHGKEFLSFGIKTD
jgi:uncharacterized tellurite resistance protein B-like protein